jgi:aspartate racemase
MHTLGLIGGMSWESTAVYYKVINERIKERLGGSHSAKCIVYSFDFHEIEQLQQVGDWIQAGNLLGKASAGLKHCDADVIVICTNTMHKLADTVELQSGLPVLHIADATAAEIAASGLKKVGLLGTRYTMEQDFYKGRLVQKHGLEVLVPDEHQREIVHNVIYNELCNGIVKAESREKYVEIIQSLQGRGAQGVILGCTEIGLLVTAADVRDFNIQLFDTTIIHAKSAADWSIDG